MKFDKRRTFLTAVLLSVSGALAGAGCLTTALLLDIADWGRIGALWLLTAFLGAALFPRRRGSLLLYCTAAMLLGYFWHQKETRNQAFSLFCRLAQMLHEAYHWDIPSLPAVFEQRTVFDYPIGIWGGLTVLGICRWVCTRRKSAVLLGWLMLPLVLCFLVTDTVPEEAPLYALLVVLTLLLLTQNIRLESISQSSRLVWIAVIPVMLTFGLVFWLIPKDNYVNKVPHLQDRLADYAEMLPNRLYPLQIRLPFAQNNRVDLSTLGEQPQKGIPVMEITSQRGGTIYLRGQDYDIYTGTGWESSSRRERFCGRGETVDVIDIQTRGSESQLYLPYYPAAGAVLTDGRLENSDHLNRYSMAVAAPEVSPYPSEVYRLLPASTLEQGQEIVRVLSSSGNPAADIQNYVTQSARYDRTTGRMPEGQTDFALWFLRESETGYCVHFATAAAVLLRSMGIPARYVTGFLVEAAAGEPSLVTTDNAHAWTEYYDDSTGRWCLLDATPSQDDTPVPEETTVPAKSEQKSIHIPPMAFRWLLLVPGLWILIAVQRFFRLALRRQKQRRGTPAQRAILLWQEAERLSRLSGSPIPEELELLAQKAKFSRQGLTEEELLPFQSHRQAVQQKLKRQNWCKRMVYWGWDCVI